MPVYYFLASGYDAVLALLFHFIYYNGSCIATRNRPYILSLSLSICRRVCVYKIYHKYVCNSLSLLRPISYSIVTALLALAAISVA